MIKHSITPLPCCALLLPKSAAIVSQINSIAQPLCTNQVKVELTWTTVWETEKQVHCGNAEQSANDEASLPTHILIAGADLIQNCSKESYLFGTVKWSHQADVRKVTESGEKDKARQQTQATGVNI